MKWLYHPNRHIHIEHLWLDFDLGLNAAGLPHTTTPFANELASLHYNDEGRCTVDTTYIISMNVVGRDRIRDLATHFSEVVIMTMPLWHGLVAMGEGVSHE